MNWIEFADRIWATILFVTIGSFLITIAFAFMNIIIFPELDNYPIYVAGIGTLILFVFFLFLWFQPKEKQSQGNENNK